MRPDRPSATAGWIALARALADQRHRARGFSDPFAERLLPPVLSPSSLMGRLVGASLVDMVAVRTMVIDEALRSSVAPQLVLLGAGLDARAWRMGELGSTVVFEVDHPAMQAYKRQKVAGLRPAAKEVRFVSVDFESQSLGERLAAAGHDAASRTFWIWEGVIPYLRREAMRETLDVVSDRSVPGSRLAALYNQSGFGRRLTNLVTRPFGEPQRSSYSPEEMAAEIARAGLRVVRGVDLSDWGREHGIPLRWPFRDFGSHLVISEMP